MGYDVSSNTIQEYFKKSNQWVSWVMNGRNGEGGLLCKISNIIEEDITMKDEMKSIRRKVYRFVGEWKDLTIYEKIAEIIE